MKPVVKTPAKPVEKEEKKKEEKKEEAAEVEKEEPMDTIEEDAETPRGRRSRKAAEKPAEEKPAEEKPEEEKPTEEGTSAPPPDDTALEFDPDKFTPGYVPKTVKKGSEEYMIVVSGVKDTGLCGNYWNVGEGGRRRSRPPETLQMGKEKRRGSVGSVGSETSGKNSPAAKKGGAATPASAKSSKKQVTKPEKVEAEEAEVAKTPLGRGRKRKTEETPSGKAKSAKKEVEDDTKEFSDYDSGNNETQPLRKRPKKEEGESSQESSKQLTAVAAALAAGVPGGQQRSVSCVADTNTQKEVVVECFAPYDDHRWVNIGKERDGMAPDAVQYARALRPPYHLLSFLR